jgi:hypothetical protein
MKSSASGDGAGYGNNSGSASLDPAYKNGLARNTAGIFAVFIDNGAFIY